MKARLSWKTFSPPTHSPVLTRPQWKTLAGPVQSPGNGSGGKAPNYFGFLMSLRQLNDYSGIKKLYGLKSYTSSQPTFFSW